MRIYQTWVDRMNNADGLETKLPETSMLLHILALHHQNDQVRDLAVAGQDALEVQNKSLAVEATTQLLDILKDWSKHPALANQIDAAANELDLESPEKAPAYHSATPSAMRRKVSAPSM